MTPEEINEMADNYIDIYAERFQGVARQSYIDGMLDAMKWVKQQLMEL